MSDLLYIISRQCAHSNASAHKSRPDWFSREKCFKSLWDETFGLSMYVVFDEHYGSFKKSFISTENMIPESRIHRINEGSEAKAFLKTLDYINSLNPKDDDVIYIVEDDYLHRADWPKVLAEGIKIADKMGGAYVTLYDHADKYQSEYYGLKSEIFISDSCHWRTTPSTTNTYAFRYKTLKKTQALQRQFSEGVEVTQDHQKFIALRLEGQKVISCMPGWSTHVEAGLLSPCLDWKVSPWSIY